jgi:adenylate kinase
MKGLFSNISFIGGIHGVGKSTICNSLCTALNIHYLSASEVLKWVDLNDDTKNKKVQNITLTQDRLINGLITRVEKNHHYLLDGHYCLLDKNNTIVKIPFETFEAINPVSLHLIIGNVSEIKLRLESRDQRIYDYQLLDDMQNQEIDYAKELSKKLNIDLNFGKEKNYSDILVSLSKLLNKQL